MMEHLGLVMLTTFLYGFRHGIDWDHIAAITDITRTAPSLSAARTGRSVLFLSTMYVLGHAAMVVTLGSAALLAQTLLPSWVDPILERVVGVTLLILAAWVFYSLVQYLRGRGEFRLRSRWMLVFSGIAYLWHRLHAWLEGRAHEHKHRLTQYSPVSAFIVGIIHGIGAETGSQVLLIAAVGGAAGPQGGLLLMGSFVAGLVLSNSLIAVVTAAGFVGAQSHRRVYVSVGVAAGLFSLVVGVYFLTGRAENLPDIPGLFGGAD
jgi:high-affinity nickel-transport protein